MIRQIFHYQTSDGKQPFSEWYFSLTEKRTQARIAARFERILAGNFGDIKLVGTGVWELRFHFGPGYRVYFGLDGDRLVILLCGGAKSTQDKDIEQAKIYWQDYLRRRG